MEEDTKPSTQEERRRKNRRPPRPLTHKMDAGALQNAYFKAGLIRPELTHPRKRSDKNNAPEHKAPISQQVQDMSTRLDENGNPIHDLNPKPHVPGTQQRQAAGSEESFNMKCAKAGGTGLVVLVLGQLSWIGLRRWLG